MCFVEPIVVCLFAICYSNVYIHLLFTKIILLDTIYLPKFLQSCFYSSGGSRALIGGGGGGVAYSYVQVLPD